MQVITCFKSVSNILFLRTLSFKLICTLLFYVNFNEGTSSWTPCCTCYKIPFSKLLYTIEIACIEVPTIFYVSLAKTVLFGIAKEFTLLELSFMPATYFFKLQPRVKWSNHFGSRAIRGLVFITNLLDPRPSIRQFYLN